MLLSCALRTRPFLTQFHRHYSAMSKKLTTAACCVIGDEILNGKTRDSNAYFLAKYLFDLGIDLRRVETIPDDYESIAETIKRLSSQHDFVFTSGGIGPTHDDITYAAIAKTYSLPLVLDQETCQQMETSSKDRYPNWTLTEERKRMATFPEPSIKLRPDKNFWVPVVVVNKNIHILPGIPKLFEGLLESLRPYFLDIVGDQKGYHRIQIATELGEGDIAPFLTQVQNKVSDIKIGSYPKWGMQQGVRVVVSVVGKNQEQVGQIGKEIMQGIKGWIYQ